MASLRLYEVVLDCPDPRALAEFYRPLLGWEYEAGHEVDDPEREDWLRLEAPHGGPRIVFQRSDAPVTPWRRDARIHLDLAVDDLAAGHEHAVARGATPMTGTPEEEGHPADRFRVYADPVGHVFCLVEPTSPVL
ncbi:VOC family protein [Antribacter gilvus]|uniref:VOC family protein n=1 Tax=Antribacter gilvus TaxID=2304675 RepID=UPI000F793D52|nr:VOC family protein [Antribacter gilvus]